MNLTALRVWIFDLDGTLTKPVHDFAEIRQMLGLPDDPESGILEQLEVMEPKRRESLTKKLDAYEYDLACASEASPGAAVLLEKLRARDLPLGIVTRNNERNAVATLAAAGLSEFFDPALVVTRETGLPPKPAPDGIAHLLSGWGADPKDAVMVGNHLIDVEAGRAAGTHTVQIDQAGVFEWGEPADAHVTRLDDLL